MVVVIVAVGVMVVVAVVLGLDDDIFMLLQFGVYLRHKWETNTLEKPFFCVPLLFVVILFVQRVLTLCLRVLKALYLADR